ncbi:head-tail connector protein [Candidatus Pacearchaeota archaeon]|nr:head-tail connector protein [Candidatus Pacearchaeota archaeon]
MATSNSPDRDRIKTHTTVLSGMIEEFESWRDHYVEIANYVLPRKGRFLGRDEKPNDGKKRNDFINNGAAGRDLRTSAAGLQSGLTSPARPWFRLTLADKDLAEFAPVKEYLEETRKRLNAIFASSNFYVSTHTTYKELLEFATSAMIMEESQNKTLRCIPYTAGEYFIGVNEDREVDTLYRLFWNTARQLHLKFGDNALESTAVKSSLDTDKPNGWFRVVQAIVPNSEREYDRVDNLNMPWSSDYYLYEHNEEKFLRQSGYEMFPCMAPRWDVTGSDIYGLGPTMDALPDIKMLQSMEGKVLKAIDKQIDPSLNVPSDLKGKVVSLLPGGINYVAGGQGNAITPISAVNTSIRDASLKIEQVKQDIREGLYADLFKMLISGNDPTKTATEIIKKHEEKLSLLGPVIERLQPEFLDPLIDRAYFIADSRGKLPDLPPELEDMDIDIEYVSPLAQAQKMLGTAAIEETFNFAAVVAQSKPLILDKLDEDEAIEQFADMKGLPVKIIRTDAEAKKTRDNRAKQQEIEKRAQAMERTAAGVKDLSSVSPEQAESMENVLGGLGGVQA